VRINIRIPSLGCLATFALLFAVSTPAQKFRVPGHAPSQKSAGDASPAGRSQAGSDAVRPDIPVCAYQFTSGSGQTYLQFCVTVNGNIIEFQNPAGVEQIAQGPPNEGYGICDSFEVGYYDYAAGGASSNWNAPTLVSKTATMVKIARTTSDGLWTLTQTITSSAGPNPFAKIVMALKNNSSVNKTVYLYRYALALPADASSSGVYAENYDGTQDSAWGYQAYDSGAPYGLMLQNVGSPLPDEALADIEGFARDVAAGPPNPCEVTSSTTIYNGVGSIMFFYAFQLTKEQTITATVRYLSF
jgi:hypothetical protein